MLSLGLGLWQFNSSGDSMALITQTGVAGTTITGVTTEQTLDTINISAARMLANGRLNFWFSGTHAGVAGTKTWRLKFGGTTIATIVMAATSSSYFDLIGTIWNVNSQSSQRARFLTNRGADALITSAAEATAAIDTSAATTLVLTGQLSVGTDTMTRSSYYVDVTPLG